MQSQRTVESAGELMCSGNEGGREGSVWRGRKGKMVGAGNATIGGGEKLQDKKRGRREREREMRGAPK